MRTSPSANLGKASGTFVGAAVDISLGIGGDVVLARYGQLSELTCGLVFVFCWLWRKRSRPEDGQRFYRGEGK